MDFFKDMLNTGKQAGTQLLAAEVSKRVNPESRPDPTNVPTLVAVTSSDVSKAVMTMNMKLLIGGGVALAAVVLFVALRK